MKAIALRMSCLAALLVVGVAPVIRGADAPLTARITLPDGTIRMAKLEGLGCSKSICSRVVIKGDVDGGSLESVWLDGIAAIKDTTENDALVVMKNGTEQRMSLVTDFRVLYLAKGSRSSEKLDLSKIKSVEFLPSEK